MNTTPRASLSAAQVQLQALPQLWAGFMHRVFIALRNPARPASATRHVLDKGATAWIEKPFGREVVCVAGTLWLTFDGEPQDVILEAGESHRCTQGSKLAIHALAAAQWSLGAQRKP
jgi:hypothetical protein